MIRAPVTQGKAIGSPHRSVVSSKITRIWSGLGSSGASALRQRVGNQGVHRWMVETAGNLNRDVSILSPSLQAKLNISQPGDAHEQEADRVADAVMRMPSPDMQQMPVVSSASTSKVQRLCTECDEELGKKSGAQVKRKVQAAEAPPITPSVGSNIQALGGGGSPLPEATRAFFEPRFGHGFDKVRIHTSDHAGASARAVGARAYTVGRNVVFAPGQFAPGTNDGRHLLAHELAHVIQQTAGGEAAIARVPDERGTREGRYTFSTNCGWIDWGHANAGLTTRLIQRVQQASDALTAAGTAVTPTTGQFTTPTMTSAAAGVVLSSASVRVRLLRPLSRSEVNEVALSIFKTLSFAFEMQQFWTEIAGNSWFSQEDLPSNLIAFYMAVNGFSRQDVTTFCGGRDVSGSVAEFQRNHDFVRNFSFVPMGATGPWPAELLTVNDSGAAALYETERISAIQGWDSFEFCPTYRVVGTIGETDLFILSWGGTKFSAADDLRVVPTFRARPTTNGRYGHVNEIEVRPARSTDEAQLRRASLTWPLDLPEPVLECLTSHGNPG